MTDLDFGYFSKGLAGLYRAVALLIPVWKKWTRRRLEKDYFIATKLLRRFTTVRVGRFLPHVFPDFPSATEPLFLLLATQLKPCICSLHNWISWIVGYTSHADCFQCRGAINISLSSAEPKFRITAPAPTRTFLRPSDFFCVADSFIR